MEERVYISTDKGKDYYGTRKDVLKERRENFLTLTRDLKRGSVQIFWLPDENRYHIENTLSKEKTYSACIDSHESMENFVHAFMDLRGWRSMLNWEKMNFEPEI